VSGQLPDILGSDPRPSVFPIANASQLGLAAPESRGGIPVRTWVRSLAGMQKEALVVNGATGLAWRLVSDEGPYLAGHDRAPCPLCHFITGMTSSIMSRIASLALSRDVVLDGVRLTLENWYTMEGSALQGTMIGGALDPKLSVEIDSALADLEIRGLVDDAVRSSPVQGLLTDPLDSLFTLHRNGEDIPVGRVEPLALPRQLDPADRFDQVELAGSTLGDDLISMLTPADLVEGLPGGAGSSLQETQSRTLHVRADGVVRHDGLTEIAEHLISPIGSRFRFLSDEAPRFGGTGLAPDADTYLSAGIGFCFMTQFGRYASITRKRLDEYRIVQDTHFYPGDDESPGRMDPVETHVYLVTPESEAFARRTLDMGEQTCFLHATCRGRLGLGIDVFTRIPGRSLD
jgi:hypothetical protein